MNLFSCNLIQIASKILQLQKKPIQILVHCIKHNSLMILCFVTKNNEHFVQKHNDMSIISSLEFYGKINENSFEIKSINAFD